SCGKKQKGTAPRRKIASLSNCCSKPECGSLKPNEGCRTMRISPENNRVISRATLLILAAILGASGTLLWHTTRSSHAFGPSESDRNEQSPKAFSVVGTHNFVELAKKIIPSVVNI